MFLFGTPCRQRVIWDDAVCSNRLEDTRHHTDQIKLATYPVNAKHLYNICTMLDQRRRRWADVVQMLYKCFVITRYLANWEWRICRMTESSYHRPLFCCCSNRGRIPYIHSLPANSNHFSISDRSLLERYCVVKYSLYIFKLAVLQNNIIINGFNILFGGGGGVLYLTNSLISILILFSEFWKYPCRLPYYGHVAVSDMFFPISPKTIMV